MDHKMKSFLDRVMEAAGSVAETAGDFAKETGKKLTEKKDIAKCKTRIMRLKNEMEDDFTKIGRTIYENREGGEEGAEKCEVTLAEVFEEIDQKDAEILELTQMVEELSSERKCPSCGRMNPKDFSFCPACGEEVGQPEPEPAPESQEQSEEDAPQDYQEIMDPFVAENEEE